MPTACIGLTESLGLGVQSLYIVNNLPGWIPMLLVWRLMHTRGNYV